MRFWTFLLAALIVVSVPTQAASGQAPTTSTTGITSTFTPKYPSEDPSQAALGTIPSKLGWYLLFKEQIQDKNRHLGAKVLWFGDSIIYDFTTIGSYFWDRNFASESLDLGLVGDQTQQMLYLINHGSVAGLHPKVVVLMAGSNNIERSTPAKIAAGIEAVAADIHRHLRASKILLLGITPKGSLGTYPQAQWVVAVNDLVSSAVKAKRIPGVYAFLNLNHELLDVQGNEIPTYFLSDLVLPSGAGYEVWTNEIRPVLHRLLASRS